MDGDEPEAVATWVLTAWYGYDTVIDTGPSDTARRALPWLTPSLAAIVRQAAPVAAPGATWTRWAQAHAYATVHLTPSTEDHPPDTALEAFGPTASTSPCTPPNQPAAVTTWSPSPTCAAPTCTPPGASRRS